MDISDAQAWAIILTSAGGVLIGIIGAFKTEKVHKLVNSQLSQEKAENSMLRAILTAKQIEINSAESARKALADAINVQTNLAAATAAATISVTTTPLTPTVVPPVHVIVDNQGGDTEHPVPVVLTDPHGNPEPMPFQVTLTPPPPGEKSP